MSNFFFLLAFSLLAIGVHCTKVEHNKHSDKKHTEKPKSIHLELPPHKTPSDEYLLKLNEVISLVNQHIKLPVKGVSPFGVSFIPDGGKTWQETAFKVMFQRPTESTSEAWKAVKNSWEAIKNDEIKNIITKEKADKSAKKAKEDKIVWGKLGNIFNSLIKGHLKEGYSPTQKSLELHWAQQLIKQLEKKVEAFEYAHVLKSKKLKEVVKEITSINAILQNFEKNLKALDTLKNGITMLLAAKEPAKYAPLGNVPTINDFFNKELDFKHETTEHMSAERDDLKTDDQHAAEPFTGELETAVEGEQVAEAGAEEIVENKDANSSGGDNFLEENV